MKMENIVLNFIHEILSREETLPSKLAFQHAVEKLEEEMRTNEHPSKEVISEVFSFFEYIYVYIGDSRFHFFDYLTIYAEELCGGGWYRAYCCPRYAHPLETPAMAAYREQAGMWSIADKYWEMYDKEMGFGDD